MTAFHIVCHDCDAETVRSIPESFAQELKEMHEEANPDHNVEYQEVDD